LADSLSEHGNADLFLSLSQSGIALAGANNTNNEMGPGILDVNDGILYGNEVLELPLSQTSLVVLSACETGLGTIKGIEGSYSLGKAFLMAGAEYIISSLWSVPDKETMELMTLFYEELTRTLNIESSFQFARLEMRKRYPDNPTAWAGFVLVR
jgi:CHAT domain-containing protein